MELELGLALPIPTQDPIKGIDLNNHALVSEYSWTYGSCSGSNNNMKNKGRSFSEAFGQDVHGAAKTLPLLSWNGQPNEEKDGNGQKNRATHINNKIEREENDEVVGWPPIKSWRRKVLHNQGGRLIVNDIPRGAEPEPERELRGGGSNTNSMYVKVRMEGVAIGRKIDLRLHHSFQTLTNTLISMFVNDKYQKGEKDGVRYTLAYQDKEGDWLLAGDVPWQNFVDSVQRIEILRSRNGG